MLGGGNPVGGANPSGTGTSLNFIGNRCYAYSGEFAATTSSDIYLNFTTGSEAIIGTLQFNGFTHDSDTSGGAHGLCEISIDSQTVSTLKVSTTGEAMPCSEREIFLIAPYSRISCSVLGSTDSANLKASVTFTGEVYA